MIFIQDILDGQLYKQCRGGVCSYYYMVNGEQVGKYATVQELVDGQEAKSNRSEPAKSTKPSAKIPSRKKAAKKAVDTHQSETA